MDYCICCLLTPSPATLKKGTRPGSRRKANDPPTSGIPSTDSVPPTGRGQRQSTSGDRAIGKTPTPIPSVTSNGTPNHVGPIDGSGAKRSPCTHTGINQNPSKTSKSINSLSLCRSSLTSATHPPPSALPPPPTPSTGIPTAERSRDRGSDRPTAFDDCPQHSKSHRQIASIPPKTPSRDAPPPDIPNVHPPLLERPGKSKYPTKGGPITGSPATETTNPDTTDHTATNTTPTTDGQPHPDKKPPPDPIRPSLESGSPASRIGSAAQSKRTKTVPGGTKNTITHSRKETQSNSNQRLFHPSNPSNITPCPNHSFINPTEPPLIPPIVNKTSPISPSSISRPQTEHSSCNLSSSSYHALLLPKISPNPSPPYPIPFLIDYFNLRYFLHLYYL